MIAASILINFCKLCQYGLNKYKYRRNLQSTSGRPCEECASAIHMHVCQRSTSNSGSSHTTWYFGKSDTNIPSPPIVPQAVTGHLYVHLNSSANTYQYWMLGGNNQWESVSKGSEYPLNHDRILSIRSNGEPSWVTRASTITTQSRREREIRERSVHA